MNVVVEVFFSILLNFFFQFCCLISIKYIGLILIIILDFCKLGFSLLNILFNLVINFVFV
jgi:hypothetical protein